MGFLPNRIIEVEKRIKEKRRELDSYKELKTTYFVSLGIILDAKLNWGKMIHNDLTSAI